MNKIPIVELQGISVRVGEFTHDRMILDTANWTIEYGQHWAVLGPNGSGKTTLLRVASGYLWPSSGVVKRLGNERSDIGSFRLGVGWITADLVSQIPPNEIVKDTVVSGKFAQIGFKNLAWFQPTGTDRELATQQLESLSCEHLEKRNFGTLSQGEKQLVLIARARMAEPLLLILDEPCAGMDPGARARTLSSLNNFLGLPDAPTTIMVTHHIEEIVPSIQNVLVMKAGQIVAQGKPSEVIFESLLADIYDTEVNRIICENGRMWPIWK